MNNIRSRQQHPYHQVDASPWPILMTIIVQGVIMSIIGKINMGGAPYIKLGIMGIGQIGILWWRDVIREAKGGYHTSKVQRGIMIGFILFQISEIMQFASFFWAFFHASQAPGIEQGSTWPPEGINAVNTWGIPQQGTTVLQTSGFIQTEGHHGLIKGSKDKSQISIQQTIILGILFIGIQGIEYNYGEFTIADSVYGTVFYCTTGLHAIHVIIGVIYLTVGQQRIWREEFTTEHHKGMEYAIYYWHQVDIIWQQVFMIYYYWGS